MTFFDTKPTPTAEQIAEAKELRDYGRKYRQDAEDSFQRSDTDGFLSQWASNIGAQKNDANATLLENGGCAQFPVLVYEGQVVADKIYEFADKFNPSIYTPAFVERWKLPEDLAVKLGRKWIPTGSKSKVQKQLGLHEELRWFPAVAIITVPRGQRSTGLGACAVAYVRVVKKGEEE